MVCLCPTRKPNGTWTLMPATCATIEVFTRVLISAPESTSICACFRPQQGKHHVQVGDILHIFFFVSQGPACPAEIRKMGTRARNSISAYIYMSRASFTMCWRHWSDFPVHMNFAFYLIQTQARAWILCCMKPILAVVVTGGSPSCISALQRHIVLQRLASENGWRGVKWRRSLEMLHRSLGQNYLHVHVWPTLVVLFLTQWDLYDATSNYIAHGVSGHNRTEVWRWGAPKNWSSPTSRAAPEQGQVELQVKEFH